MIRAIAIDAGGQRGQTIVVQDAWEIAPVTVVAGDGRATALIRDEHPRKGQATRFMTPAGVQKPSTVR